VKPSTDRIHEHLRALGEGLGFVAKREVDDSLLRVRLDADIAYRPRLDLLWSLPLKSKQRHALAWLTGQDVSGVAHLPVVGIEVEGTTPSTKTMQADIANICSLGTPLGLLVVTEYGEKGIYRRAGRAIRSVRRAFGDLNVLPIEAAWLPDLMKRSWPAGLTPVPAAKHLAAAGGEHPAWSIPTRKELRKRGEEGGFVVVEPFEPPIVPAVFEHARGNWKRCLHETRDPITREICALESAQDYLTGCKIDMAWLMPLPKALGAFLCELAQLDPCLGPHGMLFPDLWTHVPVAGVELETSAGKHAGGGLLNLAAYSVLGVTVARTEKVATAVQASQRTYQPTLGMRNLFVKTMP
jgi:hypothetical protein